ncbi:BQ5605_C016g08127 [Microbotryum silenes-dioicae]|uniref:BQ5605_C016g08127 protein n=1 Tax=Microbotryum silenes-dioicae TaxID=796604 RepID=A0A2X0MH43_9BASI|nr:BQ5605_C016g08127 [Microbotryum silenes-dioicae]
MFDLPEDEEAYDFHYCGNTQSAEPVTAHSSREATAIQSAFLKFPTTDCTNTAPTPTPTHNDMSSLSGPERSSKMLLKVSASGVQLGLSLPPAVVGGFRHCDWVDSCPKR